MQTRFAKSGKESHTKNFFQKNEDVQKNPANELQLAKYYHILKSKLYAEIFDL